MQLPSPSLLAFYGALFFSTSFAQTNTTDASAQDFQIQCLRFPPMVAGTQTFNPAAITALSQAFADNSFNPALPAEGITLRGGYTTRVGWQGSGGFQVCVQNFYFFNTVQVQLQDISDAVAAMAETCCDEDPDAFAEGRSKVPGVNGRKGLCQDAKAVVKTTDGRSVKLVAQDYGDRCCGMWGC